MLFQISLQRKDFQKDFLILTFIMFTWALSALSVNADSNIAATIPLQIDPGVRIRQQEEQVKQKELRINTNPIKINDPEEDLKPESEADNEKNKPCIPIKNINIKIQRMKFVLNKLDWVHEYEGQCLTVNQITEIIQKIGKQFNDSDYFQSQAYITPQNLSDGQLEIEIKPSTLERIEVTSYTKRNKPYKVQQGGKYSALLWANFPTRKKQVLRFSDIEAGTDALNKVASLDARMNAGPGSEGGKTILYLDLKEKDRFRGYAGFDNQGQDFTGIHRFSPSLQLDNVFRIGDTWSLSYVGNADTDAIVASTSIPIYPKWTFNANYIYSNFLSFIEPQAINSNPTDVYGQYHSADVSITKSLYRRKDLQFYSSVGGSYKQSIREIGGIRLADQNTRSLYTNLYGVKKYKSGQASFGSSLYWGTPFLGATVVNKGGRDDIPDGRFVKVEGFANIYQRLPYSMFSTSLTGQWAPQATLGTEHLVIGGMYSVRGYREAILNGEQGFLNRNELQLALPQNKNKKIEFLRQRIVPLAFIDQGMISFAYNTDNQVQYIASAGVGTRINTKFLDLDLIFGFPFIEPARFDINRGGRLHFNVRFKAF